MRNKKGISAIVATVLIILITVAAVTIIWAAIIPMITDQLGSGTACLDAVTAVQLKSEGYTCINNNNDGNISFQIGRGAKDFTLADIQVLISVGGDTLSTTLVGDESKSLGAISSPNGVEVFTLTDTTYKDATQIQIAPIVGVGATQQTCDVSSTKVLRDC